MMQNPQRNIAKLARRRVLVVNNSKNPVHDGKSSAKHSKVREEAGSCCNHSKNPGGTYGLLFWVAYSCKVAEKNRLDVLKTRREEQTEYNSPLILGCGNWSLFRQGCHHQAPGTTPGRQTSSQRMRHRTCASSQE